MPVALKFEVVAALPLVGVKVSVHGMVTFTATGAAVTA